MAIISCPNCSGKLRFPDDMAPRRVKCPSCAQSFMAGPNGAMPDSGTSTVTKRKPEPPKPAPKSEEPAGNAFTFDDEPAPSKRRRDEDDDRPRAKRRDEEEDDYEEVEERPRKRGRDADEDDNPPRAKRRRDEDDEDDRPRSKRRRDEDDEDDRPRKRRRDEDDEEDDRPRSRRRGRDDYDDVEDDRPRKGPEDTKAQYANARTGIGLAGIGFWCQVGGIGIYFFFEFLRIVAGEYVDELKIPAGLAGLAAWILGAIGFSFLVAGPRKGNLLGLCIALISVTGIHLFLVIYLGFAMETRYGFGKTSSVNWEIMPTQLIALVAMIVFDFFVTSLLLASLFEVARFVLFTLVLKEYAKLTKNRDLNGSAGLLLIGQPAVLGISFVLFLILKLIAKNAGIGSEGKYIAFLMMTLEFGGYIAVYVMSALACMKAKETLYKRK